MGARPRRPDETFEEYRVNLVSEARDERAQREKKIIKTFEPTKIRSGMHIAVVEAVPHWFFWYENDKVKSTILGHVKIAQNSKTKANCLIVEIISMKTLEEKDRKKGYMEKLLDRIKNWKVKDAPVQYILTNYKDSTQKGRAFLMHRGFVHEQDVLLWRNKNNGETFKTNMEVDNEPQA